MPQWFHEMITPVMMLCVFMLNARTSFRRMDNKSGQEAERLQQILVEELRALLQLYAANIDLLECHEQVLMAPRAPMVVYRANIARLHTLDDAGLVADLIAIHNKNEQIEMLLQAKAKSVRGGSATVFLFDTVDAKFQPMLEDFAEQITACIEKYSTKSALPQPAELPQRVTSLVPQIAT
jgi:hypothetical protein